MFEGEEGRSKREQIVSGRFSLRSLGCQSYSELHSSLPRNSVATSSVPSSSSNPTTQPSIPPPPPQSRPPSSEPAPSPPKKMKSLRQLVSHAPLWPPFSGAMDSPLLRQHRSPSPGPSTPSMSPASSSPDYSSPSARLGKRKAKSRPDFDDIPVSKRVRFLMPSGDIQDMTSPAKSISPLSAPSPLPSLSPPTSEDAAPLSSPSPPPPTSEDAATNLHNPSLPSIHTMVSNSVWVG